MDIECAKCGEPWNAGGVPRHPSADGDMTFAEAQRFRAGAGCPACGFGAYCPSCSGSGKATDNYSACCTHGVSYAWSPRRVSPYTRFKPGVLYTGFDPHVREVDPDAPTLRRLPETQSRDGVVDHYVVRCVTCGGDGEHLRPCRSCSGSGQLVPIPDQDLRAAEQETSWSDEDPMAILIRRGVL